MTTPIYLYGLIALSVVSMSLNAYFLYKSKKKSKQSAMERDTQLLQDLMSNGHALIKITRIAPSDYFIRSPRDIR